MLNFKKTMLVILSLIVIAAIAFLPIALFKIYDSTILNKVSIEMFTGIAPVQLDKMDAKSRLTVLCKSEENIVITNKTQNYSNKEIEAITKNATQELVKLQLLGAFPQIDLQNNVEVVYIETMTFTDITAPLGPVQVNNMSLVCAQYKINIFMDTETNIIYQYDVQSQSELNGFDYNLLPYNFMNYIGFDMNKIQVGKEYGEYYKTQEEIDEQRRCYATKDGQVTYQLMIFPNGFTFNLKTATEKKNILK